MRRPLHIWLAFSLALVVVLAALGWVSVNLLRLDANELEAQRQAVVEENVRLALWRMDSALAPLIAQESARTYFAYRSFYPAEKAYNKVFDELDFGEVLMPSDLINPASPLVLLHFQFDPDGRLTSPQVPSGEELERAEGSNITTWANVQASCSRLDNLKQHVGYEQLLAALDRDPPLEPARQLAMQVIDNARLQQEANYLLQQTGQQLSQNEQSYQTEEFNEPKQQQLAQADVPQFANPAAQPNAQPPAPQPQGQPQGRAMNRGQEPQYYANGNEDQNLRNSVEFVKRAAPSRYQSASPQIKTFPRLPVDNGGYPGKPEVGMGGKGDVGKPTGSQPEIGGKVESKIEPGTPAASGLPPQPVTKPIGKASKPDLSKTETIEIREGAIRPVWLGDALVLARRASAGNHEYIQGCWLDWPAIQSWLKDEIIDLLPDAELRPITASSNDPTASRLAALPVQLVPGDVFLGPASWSPIRWSLAVAWVCVLLAAAAVAVLLEGVVSLSERRGAFVSAVTHEMRTPLTTFRMYTEMLADGMVTDERKRQTYLQTLQTEANRLNHLVENVLAYAKIERGRTARACEPITVAQLLKRVESRLYERAKQGQMWLVCEDSPEALAWGVRCDPAAVEQILFNLVDNACKYAAQASDRTLNLSVVRQGNRVAISVRDHGPGISDRERWRLFRPFCKSATDAAHSAPGVGLGLSLSQRLARAMHGDLRLAASERQGAMFVLTLPAA